VNSDHPEIAAEQGGNLAETPTKPSRTQEPQSAPGQESKSGGGGTALAFLALLVALAAAAGTAWMWWQDRVSGDTVSATLQADLARLEISDSRLAGQLEELSRGLESLSATSSADPLADLDNRLSTDRAQVQAVQDSLAEQIALTRAQQQAVDALHARLLAAEAKLAEASGRELDARSELDLAEVDYLLRLASERLQLFADIAGADRALALADSNLAAMDNPAYLGVRQAIATARGDLAGVAAPDVAVIAGQLDALQKAVPNLPFPAADVPAATASPVESDGWWEKLKATFASLVTVRRSTDEENRRISLLDQDVVRQRVWLQLEAAHLALMRRDQPAFGSALQRVQATSAEWFDPASSAVQSFQSSLQQLEATDITLALPDISQPWAQLRVIRAARPAPPPLASPPAASQEPAQAESAVESESEALPDTGPDEDQ